MPCAAKDFPDPHMADAATASTKNAWAFLPLIASGRATGCCVLSFGRPHSFSDEERTLLTALSSMVGQALDRARAGQSVRQLRHVHGLSPRCVMVAGDCTPTVTYALTPEARHPVRGPSCVRSSALHRRST
ncbi:GAF domain-containing protein [Streptomyces sp. NPDC002740]